MQLGMVGLGRMGGNMVRRLMKAGHECVVHTRNPATVASLVAEGATGAASIDEFVAKLRAPKTAWVMVPAGDATEDTVMGLAERMKAGDAIIDGGNSYFKDDVRRAKTLAARGISYMDVGTSGGVWGRERGYCLMVGGEHATVRRLDPVLRALAPGRGDTPRTPGRPAGKGTAEEGYLHCGPAGAGHFVKMIHNGIEYGIMQSYAEGFDILRSAAKGELPADQRFQFDVGEIAEVWRRGSVVGSWLLDLTASALVDDASLAKFTGFVQDSGEGRWTVMAAVEEGVPADVLTTALYTRFRSRQEHTYAEKVLSAMRFQFGGHVEKPAGG